MTRERLGARFCFQLPLHGHAVYQLIELAVAAAQAGFEGISASNCPGARNPHVQHTASATWPMLAAIGRRTSSILLGAGFAHACAAARPSIQMSSLLALAALLPGRPFLTVDAALAGSAWLEHLLEAARLLPSSTSQRPPIYVLGGDARIAEFAGLRTDGWIADMERLSEATARAAFRRGAIAADKDPDCMLIQVQVPVVVGGASEMEEAVETLRLFGTRYKFNAPADVNLRAAELALYDPFRQWVVGNDVAVHVRALRGFVASGATDIHIQSLQRSPRRLIDFYGRFVLPLLARA